MPLRLALSQRPALAGTRGTPRLSPGRGDAPNARPEALARGGFLGPNRRLADDDAKQSRILIPRAAAAAASSASFFPSPLDGSEQKPPSPSLTRDRPLASVVAAAIQVGLALIKIARQIVLGIGLVGQQSQQAAAVATFPRSQQQQQQRRTPPPPSSSPLLPPRPTAQLRSALSMLADTAFSLEQKLEKWGEFMLAARARAVSAATGGGGGAAMAGKQRRKRAKEAAAAADAVKKSGAKDRRVSVAAAAAALYDATTAATGADDSALNATVSDAEAALYSKIYASILLSPPESEEEKRKRRQR